METLIVENISYKKNLIYTSLKIRFRFSSAPGSKVVHLNLLNK